MSDEKEKKPKKPEAKQGAKPKAARAGDKPAKVSRSRERVPARLAETYKARVVPALMKRFNYSKPMQVPRL